MVNVVVLWLLQMVSLRALYVPYSQLLATSAFAQKSGMVDFDGCKSIPLLFHACSKHYWKATLQGAGCNSKAEKLLNLSLYCII